MNEPDDEHQELARLLVKVRSVRDDGGDLAQIHAALVREREASGANDLVAAQLVFEKWRVIHKFIHARPFALKEGVRRSEEWRLVAKRYAPLGSHELDEWIALQTEVAQNREGGVSDLRIRRDGPCYLIVLEYVGNKKRTALAVLHWAREEMGDGTR